jgi:hypothetical protein
MDASQSGRAQIIRSFSFHLSIILAICCLTFLGSGGFGQLGLAASCSLISKPRSVTSKWICFVSKVSALDSLVQPLFYTPRMLTRLVEFCPNGFKYPTLNLCPFPRLVFDVVLPALLVRLPFLFFSSVYFLRRYRICVIYFESLLWASHNCLRYRRF